MAEDKRKRLEDLQRLDYLLQFKWSCAWQDQGYPCPNNGRAHELHPYPHARDNQLAPKGDWDTWFLMSGRGFGKTRSGAEFCKAFALETPNSRIAIIAPDFAKGRDACVEGESGLRGLFNGQGCIPWELIATWNRSMGELELTNGSQFKIFSSDDVASADKLRGYQCHIAWFEELAAQKAQDHAWAMLDFALRLGEYPRTVITSTPLPTKLVKALVKDPSVIVTTGSTFDNADNLPQRTLNRLKKYDGTTLGKQELYGKLLLESAGAIWTSAQIQRAPRPKEFVRVVIGVDPAGSHKEDSDLTGINVSALDDSNFGYVLGDFSGRYSPEEWARKVNELYVFFQADCVVAEQNYGGEMVRSNLRSANFHLPIKMVHTRVGKKRRAEPIQHLYERKIIFHAGEFEELEEQMTSWIPKGRFDKDGEPLPASNYSPDRMDAMVYALSELFLSPKSTRGGMRYYE